MQVRANQPATMSDDSGAKTPPPQEPGAETGELVESQTPGEATTGPLQESLDSPVLPGLLVFVGVLVLTFTIMNMTRKRQGRMRSVEAELPSERLAHLRAAADADAGIEGRAARAADMVREATAKLETRAARLEVLLEHADQRIAGLERALDGSDTPSSAPATTDSHADPIKARVFSLADDGLSAIEIAQQTDQHVGEVELILALRRA